MVSSARRAGSTKRGRGALHLVSPSWLNVMKEVTACRNPDIVVPNLEGDPARLTEPAFRVLEGGNASEPYIMIDTCVLSDKVRQSSPTRQNLCHPGQPHTQEVEEICNNHDKDCSFVPILNTSANRCPQMIC